MRKRPLAMAIGAATIVSAALVGWMLWRGAEADRLVSEARARLEAPLSEAPELDRIQASTAVSQLERARALGADSIELTGLRHYAESLVHLARGDLIFAEGELSAARHASGWTADLRVVAAEIARRRTDLDAARVHAEDALALDPNHARALLIRADLALDRGDAIAALRDLRTLAETHGDSAVVRNRLALGLEGVGDLEGAERELREAIRLGAGNQDPYINLGRLLRRRGRHDEALSAFDQALGRSPGDPDAYLGRGLAHAATGLLPEAERDFRRAAELAPNDAEPMLALGDMLRDLGRFQEAIAIYRDALDREDADPASWLKLGNALVLTQQHHLAAASFREALERAPELAPAHNGLGAALMQVGQTDDATAALTRAAELDSQDPNPLLNLALLRERSGDRQGARTAFRRALERDPESDFARRHLERLGG